MAEARHGLCLILFTYREIFLPHFGPGGYNKQRTFYEKGMMSVPDNREIEAAMTIRLDDDLPKMPEFLPGIRRAPHRGFTLSRSQTETALKNALRYVPAALHDQLAPEFLHELMTTGRIYGYRYRPPGPIKGKPIAEYEGNCLEGRAFQVMIDNNLDFDVALYPYELVTYGETGRVCQNWMQYRLLKKYLAAMTDRQTLVVESGHPLGLFRSGPEAPRVIITNALMVGMFDNVKDWDVAEQMGVASYGQMTAGGWMYIGPQGIVHGTFNTLLNAGRLKLGIPQDRDLKGVLFVSSGLGGMSGAQPKAVEIAGGVGIIAEVDASRIETRHQQGWVGMVSDKPDQVFRRAMELTAAREPGSIAYHGNIVDLLEYAVANRIKIDLLSDQTSCHAAYEGGYCPQGLSFAERTALLREDRAAFRARVDLSLRKHFSLIRELAARGTYFFDYGNAFLKAVFDAGVREVSKNGLDEKDGFIFPSYVEDIMGPELFDYGYGPFRWVCLSGRPEDLSKTDQAAMACIDPDRRGQDRDNYVWIRDAEKNRLVVGTQARILYQDAMGRTRIALRFNEMVRNGEVGPIMLGRDHHDTSGTDSPFRETANIKDGSNVMAEMATQCFAGNAARGMSLVALHNGGGVGIGKSINGGFGMVLDGSERVDRILGSAMPWDVMGGVARRAWARNENSITTSMEYNRENRDTDHITLPYLPRQGLVETLVEQAFHKK
jgi:urocanate hydratase